MSFERKSMLLHIFWDPAGNAVYFSYNDCHPHLREEGDQSSCQPKERGKVVTKDILFYLSSF